MKAVLLTGHGGPEKLEYREDVPVPEPGTSEVLVRVSAAGVNNTDIWTREGAYGSENNPQSTGGWRREPMEFPRIQGLDIVGCVERVGAKVPESRVGERVMVDFVLYSGEGEQGLVDADIIGSEHDGGFAEYVAVPSENAHQINSPLDDEELDTFPTACVTALRMLNRARVKEGETVFVTGASGGVGSALLQLARVRGARVVAQVGPGKEDRAKSLGAEATVTRGVVDFIGAASEAANGRQIDVVADVVGGEFSPDLLNILRPLGRYVTAGAIAGPVVRLDLRTLYLKHLELIGSTMGTREEFAELVDLLEEDKLKPLLAGTYSLSEIKRAQEDFKKKDFFGKLVLVPR